MLINPNVIAASESRLTFDPQQLRASLVGTKPIENDTADRVNKRLAHVLTEGAEAARIDLERIINASDLMNINYLERGMIAARAVGRISVRDSTGELLGYGTGALISSRLLLTNHHVLSSGAQAENSQVEFNYQFDSRGKPLQSEIFALQPEAFFFTDSDLDFSLVAVAETALSDNRALADFGWLTLNREVGKVLVGEYLTIIQHPSGAFKQIAVRENQLIKLLEFFLWYMTDTAAGSSGAPVFNDSWQVVALHHSGVPARDADGNILTSDGQIWDDQMDETKIKWIANEGVRVSCIVEAIERAHAEHPLVQEILDGTKSQQPELIIDSPKEEQMNEASADGTPNAPSKPAPAPETPSHYPINIAQPVNANGHAISLTVPLHITIQLGEVAVAGQTGPGQPVVTPTVLPAFKETVSIDPNYSNRKGYNPSFLGTGNRQIPLPTMTSAMQAQAAINKKAAPGADKHVLPYHHYSVVLNKARRLAFYSVVNIDGRIHYRPQRDPDKWIFDPRIGKDEQTGEEVYVNNPLDRGHLVRRLDPAWGTSEQIAKVANDDTFHFTNCTPQHQDFNQKQTLWAGLEDYILNNAEAESLKVTVFNGPVFSNSDQEYRGVQLPKQFWKVVAMVKTDGKLSATAYLLSQASLIKNLVDEAFSYGAYRTFQVPVKKIEALTGLNFGNLSQFDPTNHLESFGVREIGSFEDRII
ncbi:MAG: DNA/RNA non-specific endonuclease [Pyrinomonadaceae bacterium]